MIVIDLTLDVNTFPVKLDDNITNNFRLLLSGLGNNIDYVYELGSPTFSNSRYQLFDLRLSEEIYSKEILATGQYRFSISENISDEWVTRKFGEATIVNSNPVPENEVREVEIQPDEDDVRSADRIIYADEV